jgi:hypothetical protein
MEGIIVGWWLFVSLCRFWYAEMGLREGDGLFYLVVAVPQKPMLLNRLLPK